jgi:hypothetical protein
MPRPKHRRGTRARARRSRECVRPRAKVSHNIAEGTRVTGPRSRRLARLLSGQGFLWSERGEEWWLPGTFGLTETADADAAEAALRAAGFSVARAETSTGAPIIAGRLPAGIIALREAQYVTFAVQRDLFERLLARLVKIGGERLVIPPAPDTDLRALLGPGARQFDACSARLQPGAPSACHANTSILWRQGRADIATGYAMSPDGVWVQHSWGVERQTGVVLETTVARVHYFGIGLTEQLAAEFALANPQ